MDTRTDWRMDKETCRGRLAPMNLVYNLWAEIDSLGEQAGGFGVQVEVKLQHKLVRVDRHPGLHTFRNVFEANML